jgi:O-antigen ligase
MRYLVFILLMLMVFMIPWENLVILGAFGTLIRAFGLGAAILGFLVVISTGRIRGLLLIHYLMGLFVAFAILSMVWTNNGEMTLTRIMTLGQLLVFSWMIWEFVPDAFRQQLLLHAYVWGGGMAIVLQILGFRAYSGSLKAEMRFAAGTMNVNEFAAIVLMSIPMAVYLASDRKLNRLLRLAYMAYCPVCALSILLTGSRMGLVVMCIGAALVSFIYFLKRPFFSTIMLVIAGMFLSVVVPRIIPETTWARLSTTSENIQSGTWGGRLGIYELGLSIYQQYPVLGTGAGTYAHMTQEATGERQFSGQTAHNAYLDILVEMGPIGLLLFLAILLVAFIYTNKLPFRERYTWRIILFCWCLCAFVGTLETFKFFWLILGLVSCQYSVYAQNSITKLRAEHIGALDQRRQLLMKSRWGNTRGI